MKRIQKVCVSFVSSSWIEDLILEKGKLAVTEGSLNVNLVIWRWNLANAICLNCLDFKLILGIQNDLAYRRRKTILFTNGSITIWQLLTVSWQKGHKIQSLKGARRGGLEVNQTTGSTYLLEGDRANRSTYLWAFISLVHWIAAPWPDVEDGINVESGVSHSSIVLDHGLFETGSCLEELGLVYDGPAVDHPLGIAKQGGSGDGEEGFV